jgi:dipeptidyl aminopeptidase/acylaminoacyl peptidase
MNRTLLSLRRPAALVLVFAATALASPAAQERRLITETDLLKFVWIADPQISPDGGTVAFVRVTANEQKDDYETSVWVVPTQGGEPARPLTSGTRDTSPRWAPDGRRIVFARSVEREGRPQPPQLHLLSLDGGEARPLTDLARGASAPVWSPDGQRIAFASTTRSDDTAPAETTTATPPKKSDVRVITSATYRSNGGGWNDPERPSHLWAIDVPAGPEMPKPLQLTDGTFSEGGHVWSTDGSRIFFVSTRVEEPYFRAQDSDLFAVPSRGGAVATIASIDGSIGNPSVSPDGRSIAFIGTLSGTPERSYSQSDLFVADLEAGLTPGPTTGAHAPKNLTAAYDFDIGGGIGGDQAAPRSGGSRNPIWLHDNRSIVVVAGEQGDANLIRFSVDGGKPMHVLKGSHAVQSFTASTFGTVAAVVSTPTVIGDLISVRAPGVNAGVEPGEPRRITGLNDDLFKQLRLSEPEEVWWTSFDGKRIQGWLLHPPDFDKSKKYPFILEIHGGPHSAYGNTFTHEFHWMAAKGYVVLFPNPRGSSNYGQDFGNVIQYRYPGDDYKDLMAGVDLVVKRGYVDEKRLGVTGGSGGGLLTNWTITQTTRFAAAVSQRSIADWSGFWYTADFTLFTPTWFRKAPWEDPADFTARSPITHVAKVKTPLMVVDGDDDLRTPPSDGGEMMFRALKYLKVPTVMVRFPGETHELSRSGKPRHRIERLQHIVGWFDKWLMGNQKLYETTTSQR